MKSNMIIKVGLCGVLCASGVVSAAEKVIMQLMRTKSQFEYYIQQYPIVVVYCYALPEHNQKKEEEVRRVYSILQKNMLAHAQEYQAAHVKFIAVNRSVGDLVSLQKEYGFTNNKAYLMFFKRGKAVAMNVLTEAVALQKINALITARHLEKMEQEPETKTVQRPRQVIVEQLTEEDENFQNASCCEEPTERGYCANRMCKHCRYKRPISYYEGEADFLMGFDHLYSNSYSPIAGNYWGGTITNPIN